MPETTESSSPPRRHVLVGTHHKTGTVWMMRTFRRISERTGRPFVALHEGKIGWTRVPGRDARFAARRREVEARGSAPGIFFEYHSDFPVLADPRSFVGLHVVRDPRDVLISSARFHLDAEEVWLRRPDPRFSGRTYQQMLRELDDPEDRIRFEMDHATGDELRRMRDFDRQGVFRDVRYEDLVVDVDLRLWHEIVLHLGFRGEEIVPAIESFWRCSLFGGANPARGPAAHVRDGRPAQWRTAMSPDLVAEVETRFGDLIRDLGYPLARDGAPGGAEAIRT